jgi:hypothetical protein
MAYVRERRQIKKKKPPRARRRARDEIVQWKVKRAAAVPRRGTEPPVDDRSGPGLPQQAGGRGWLLVAYALEGCSAQLEERSRPRGRVGLGRITSEKPGAGAGGR